LNKLKTDCVKIGGETVIMYKTNGENAFNGENLLKTLGNIYLSVRNEIVQTQAEELEPSENEN